MSDFTGIELQRALDLMSNLSKEFSFTTNQSHLYDMLITSCPVVDVSGNPFIERDVIRNFMLNFQHALKTGDSSSLRMERGLKVKRIVDVIEFAEAREYMNQAGHLRPVIKQELHRLFHEPGKFYVEAVLGGATNVGKNYFSEIAIPYMLYCLSCYRSPQVEFGLAPGSPIFFIVQSVTMTLAKRVAFGTMQARIRLSPYFQRHFPYDQKIKAELRFPNDISIVPVSGAETSALGMNVWCFPKGQPYLLDDGTIGKIGYTVNKKCLTLDETNYTISSTNTVNSVFVGHKQIVRMVFETGDTIDCTPEQKFEGIDNEWYEAQDAEGRTFKTLPMPDMRCGISELKSSYQENAPNWSKRIQSYVSRLWACLCRKGNKKNSGTCSQREQEKQNSDSNMPSMRNGLSDDYRESSEKPRNDYGRVQGKVSQRKNENKGNLQGVFGESKSACAGATQRPKVQGIITEGDKKNKAFSLGEECGATKRSGTYSNAVEECEKTVCKPFRRNQTEDDRLRACGEIEGGSLLQFQIQVQGKGGKRSNFAVKNGNSYVLFFRLLWDALGIRTGQDSIQNRKALPLLHTGFQNIWKYLCGSKRSTYSGFGQALGSKTESSAGIKSGNAEAFQKVRTVPNTQLVNEGKKNGNQLGRTEPKISGLKCIEVRKLNITVPVYDLYDVQPSHKFMAVLKNGSCSIVAHNSGLIDEANFHARTVNSTKTKYTDELEFDQAQRSYNIMIKRIKGRFMQRGKVPGKLLLVSSANYEGDFISRKITEAREDNTIFVMYYTQWDAFRDEDGKLPRKRYSGDMFLVEKGNDIKSPRILNSMEDAINEEDVIEVPIEHRSEFEKDIVQSLKDLAGVGAKVLHPFIMKRELIKQAVDDHVILCDNQQLFTAESMCLNTLIDLQDPEPDWELVVNQKYLDDVLNPDVVHACHIDLAKNQDACGLAISHIVEYQHKDKVTIYDKSIGDFQEIEDVMVPIYMVDGAVAITNPPGDEIDFEIVKRLVLYLRGKLNLQYVSLDIFNSVMMIQAFRRAKIKSGLLSVDSDLAPYNEVKTALKDGRIYLPNSGVLQKELRELELDNIKGKVDHPLQGCFTGDTEVVTIDNQGVFKVLTFDELCILYKAGKTYNTLTHDPKVCPVIRSAPIVHPRITKYVDTLIELELETGEIVKCTPEHLFLLTNGEYKEVQYLTTEDELFSV